MNAMMTLRELRRAKSSKHNQRAQCDTIKEQLEQILVLKREKEMLMERLDALTSGPTVEELNTWEQDSELTDRSRILRELRDKISAYRFIGPCGLTVLDANPNSLKVSFSPMWQSLTESFTLSLVAKDNSMEVFSTTIPCFVDVPSLVTTMKSDVAALMEAISHKLISYVQRKGEVLHVLKTHADFIANSSFTDAVTSVELKLQTRDADSGGLKDLTLYMTYSSLDDVLPGKVEFSTESLSFPGAVQEDLRHQLMTLSLSTAMDKVITWLTSSQVHIHDEPQSQSDDDD